MTDLANWLAARGCGTLGVDLFLGSLPAEPPAAAAIQERPGLPPVNVFGGVAWEQPRLLVEIRDETYVAGRARAQAFYVAFLSMANVRIGGNVWLSVDPRPPEQMDTDENGRPIFGVSVEARRTLDDSL